MWRYERVVRYMNSLTRVAGPSLEQKNTPMRENILVQTKIAMALT
jgi:hypothetical protein